MKTLEGKVALVTGASRGVGRGVAIGLGEQGARVYLSGRTLGDGDSELPGSLRATADEVSAAGGDACPVQCDHTDDAQVAALFDRIDAEAGRLDVLVNAAWGGYERMVVDGAFTWPEPFWRQPAWRWDAMFGAGVRAAYVASARAAERMVRARAGLIVQVSAGAALEGSNVVYVASKAATDKLAADMATELAPHGVTVVSLHPGLVRTEAVLASGAFDLSESESPELQGRAIAALAADREVGARNGRVVVTGDLARDYGIRDVPAVS